MTTLSEKCLFSLSLSVNCCGSQNHTKNVSVFSNSAQICTKLVARKFLSSRWVWHLGICFHGSAQRLFESKNTIDEPYICRRNLLEILASLFIEICSTNVSDSLQSSGTLGVADGDQQGDVDHFWGKNLRLTQLSQL